MPRQKGIGRKRKQHIVPLAKHGENTHTGVSDVSEEEPEPEPEPERLEDWLCGVHVVLDVADEAVRLQRERNRRFCKYAATASACAEMAKHSWDVCQAMQFESAWIQANLELECCCVDPPYCSASPRFRCHACGDIVCNCMCTVECKCGQKLSRWSWRYDLDWQRARFGVCRCGRERPRVGFDWGRFDLP